MTGKDATGTPSNRSGTSDASGTSGNRLSSKSLAFATRAVHSGYKADPLTGAVMPPIHLATTYEHTGIGQNRGYTYSRVNNPTRKILEDRLTDLEGARFGFSFASGIAAEDATLRGLREGDHILFSSVIYGGTYRLITELYARHGITSSHVNMSDPQNLIENWHPDTKVIWVESPTNPLVTIVDIATVSAIARERGAICVVDNTFASPYLQHPLDLGADVVTHSTTKYISGHSDMVGGFAATNNEELAEQLKAIQITAGAVPSPLDCFLTLRGVMTLALRMEKHCANAMAVAEFLDSHPAVAKVNYPGLSSHPGHETADRQMGGKFGAMMSIIMEGGPEAAKEFSMGLELFAFAESLGGVESLVSYPHAMSHSNMVDTSIALDEALVRISIGIEDAGDLIQDMKRGLDALSG